VLSHANSGTNAVFEIQWSSGDVTWLPYDQISGLPAITTYLDLLGIDDISNLPKGNGKPPQNDPQTYLGTVAIKNCGSPDHKRAPKISRFFTHLFSPIRSCFHSRSSIFNPSDQTIILTNPIMDVDQSSTSGTPVHDPTMPVHPLIELTPENDFIVKTNPNDKSSASPRGQVYSKNIISDYVDYSLRCQEAASSGSLDNIINLRSRTPIGYPSFAKYYNNTSSDGNGRFTIYDKVIDTFMLVCPDISLSDFGIPSVIPVTVFTPVAVSILPIVEAGPSNDNKHPFNRKPYGTRNFKPKQSPSLTSILQQTQKLRGFDGLLADLLVTSASQHAAHAKMGTLHFGIRRNKCNDKKPPVSHNDKNKRTDDSDSKAPTDPSMEGIEAGPSSSPST
jgi:hypothetical protein